MYTLTGLILRNYNLNEKDLIGEREVDRERRTIKMTRTN